MKIHANETVKHREIKSSDEKDGEKSGQDKEDDAAETEKADEQAGEPAKPEKPTVSKKEKRRLCNEARSDIAAISSRGRMREINAKGEYTYLSEKQRQKRLADARKKQQKNCR